MTTITDPKLQTLVDLRNSRAKTSALLNQLNVAYRTDEESIQSILEQMITENATEKRILRKFLKVLENENNEQDTQVGPDLPGH